MAKRVNRAKCA